MRLKCSLIAIFLLFTAFGTTSADNLLTNPSFEEVQNGKPVGWRCVGFDWYVQPKDAGLSRAQLDETIVQGPGHRSIKLIGNGNRGMVRQTLKYQPEWGRKLLLSGWIKLQDTGSASAHIGVSFIDDGEWLSEAGVHTSWKKSTADWEYFEREIEVPQGTTHLHFHCRSAKPNDGIMWFDNLALQPLQEQKEEPQHPTTKAPPATADIQPLIPIDTFESADLAWGCSAWHGAEKANLSIETNGAAAGQNYMRVDVQSAENNWLTRPWNYDGPWDGVAVSFRAVSGPGRAKVYFRSRNPSVVFNVGSIAIRPDDGWQTLSAAQSDISHAWGGKSDADKQFDPDAISDICIAYDDAITFDVDQIALDVRDHLAIRTAHTDRDANLYSPGDRPRILAEIINGHDRDQSCTFQLRLTDYRGNAIESISRDITCPARSYSDQAAELPALKPGYYIATASLTQNGRILTPREVGVCVLPAPSHTGKPFMGASGFGIGRNSADIGYKLGVQSTEIFIDWHRVEPQRGQLNFDSLDAELDAFEERDFAVTGMLHLRPSFIPDWATDDQHDFATDPREFGRFVETVVSHFKGRIHRWSFCSEVDLAHHGWKQGLQGYVEMVKAGYDGAKRADPNCICGAIGVSGGDARKTPRFPIARKLWPKLADHCDGMFFDLYASPRFYGPGLHVVSPAENDLLGKLREALQIVRKYGPDKRLAIEEKGWAIDPELDVCNAYSRRMADYLARSYIVARSVDEVDHYMWFQLIVRRLAGGQFSYSLFRFEADHANPRPPAAAYAFVAQFLAGVDRPQSISLHQDLRAFVFAADAGSRAALWTPLDENVSLQVDLPNSARITDLMGGPVHLGTRENREQVELSGSPIYIWADNASAADLASRLRKASFHLPCAKLAITIPHAEEVRVHVNNQLSEPLKGHVTLDLPQGFTAARPSRPLSIPAGAERAVAFSLEQWPKPLPRKPGAFTATLRTQQHGDVHYAHEPTFWPIARIASPPTIDADLSEYVSLPAINLDSQTFLSPPDAVPNKLWTGTGDLSVTARLAWDADNLYFAATIRDDSHIQERTGSRMWANDSIQFAIDPLNDSLGKHYSGSAGYDDDDYEFGFALTPDGPQTFRWHGAPGAGLVTGARLAVARIGNDTAYECALPWREVGRFQPQPGRALGLNFIALDSDTPGEKALYWLGLTEGIAGGKNPAAFNTFILQPPAE